MIERNEKINQRIFIFFPLLILFYIALIKTVLPKYSIIVSILFAIQIVTHVVLLISGLNCTPKQNNICNNFAKLIGFVYLFIILDSGSNLKHKKNWKYYFCLFVTLYIILSHFITIYPIKGLFEYKNVSLSIFDLNTYILIFSDLLHERKLKHELENILKGNNVTMVDAGAYIGDTSILLAKKYPNSLFYAIEPSVKNFNFITKTKNKNNIDNLTVLNCVLSNDNSFYSVKKNLDQPNAQYEIGEGNNGIQSYTLDSLVNSKTIKGKIGILHYDVEGMELDVLNGSKDTIEKDKPYIILEFLNTNQISPNQNLIIKFLVDRGYNYKIIDENCCFGDFFDLKKCRNFLFYY